MTVPPRDDPSAPSPVPRAGRLPLFRATAVAAARYRGFGPVSVVSAPGAGLTSLVAIFALSAIAAGLVLIELPERARAVGVLLPVGGIVKVRAVRTGTVDRLAVKNGSEVAEGEPLMWLGSAAALPDLGRLASVEVASLRRQLEARKALLDAITESAGARRKGLQQRLRLLTQRLAAARRELAAQLEKARIEQRRAERIARLAADGRLARQAADAAGGVALAASAEGEAARQRVLAIEAEISSVKWQFEAEEHAAARERAADAVNREVLLRDLAQSALRVADEIRAPAAGVVAGLTVREGSVVRPGETLLTLYDRHARLEAHLYVVADNAAFLHVGQRIELRLTAYPHQIYGTVPAAVTEIGAVATSAQSIDVAVPIAGPVFEIRAAIADPAVVMRGERWVLPPGTAIEADLIRGRWPLYGWLFRGLRSRMTGDG